MGGITNGVYKILAVWEMVGEFTSKVHIPEELCVCVDVEEEEKLARNIKWVIIEDMHISLDTGLLQSSR